jgi:predicted ATPase/DNA-binding winged helix-turn-helix (wHTH) protein
MSTTYCFDRFEIQPVERRLIVDGQPTSIGARAFDLLTTLVENPGRLITKSELLDRVWPGLVVEEANLHVQISGLRKLLGPQVIATIPGQGYRLAVEPERAAGDPAAESAGSSGIQTAPDATAHAFARHHNLPEATESLIGREADVELLNRLLDQHRLVSVVGGSGIGKTRLAQAVARQRVSLHADGVWWADLAVLRTADQIAPAMAQAAGLALGDGDAERMLRLALEQRDTLLVLDNCEHLVNAVAALTTTLLDAAPRLRILATSLEPLKTRGEQTYRLEGLAVPPGPMSLELARCFAAVQLLECRAQAVDHRFRLTEASVRPAIELCRQLDGIALAIEMAAGRLPTLGLEETHARLGDRLRLLRSTSRSAPARQQTLGATLEWSHALLTPDEQAALRRLSVFAGSFGLDAALAVAVAGQVDESAALDALFGLVDKSMLQIVGLEPPRYRLLETTRLFAAQRLKESGEAQATAQRHCRAMAGVAVEAEQALWTMADRPWLQRFLADHDDLQSAFERACADQESAWAADLAAAGAALDHVRGIMQGRRKRLAAAAALLPSAQGPARAKLLGLFATSYATTAADGGISRVDAARELVDIYRELGDTQRLYDALGRRALVAAMAGDRPTAERAMAEGRQLEQGHWPPRLRERFRVWLTGVQGRLGDAAGYAQTVREIVALAEQGGLENSAATMQAEMVDLALLEGDAQRAVEMGHKAMTSLHRLGMTSAWGMTAAYLCSALALCGQLQEARENASKAQPVLRSLDLEGLLFVHLAVFCARARRLPEAARLVGCAQAWYAANHNAPDSTVLRLFGLVQADVEAALGSADFERLRGEGAALPAGEAAALLQTVIGIADDR